MEDTSNTNIWDIVEEVAAIPDAKNWKSQSEYSEKNFASKCFGAKTILDLQEKKLVESNLQAGCI